MNFALVFVLVAFVLLLCFAYLATCRTEELPDLSQAHTTMQAVDVQAFRNLVDPDEDTFLRNNLPRPAYRQIKRERALAARGYVRELSQASLQFARFGDVARRSLDPAIAESGRQIANSAISLRLGAFEANLRLAFQAAFPGLDSGHLRSLSERYDRTATLLENLGGLERARNQAS